MNDLCVHDQVGCALLQHYLCAGDHPSYLLSTVCICK